jgi:hypothetical protein
MTLACPAAQPFERDEARLARLRRASRGREGARTAGSLRPPAFGHPRLQRPCSALLRMATFRLRLHSSKSFIRSFLRLISRGNCLIRIEWAKAPGGLHKNPPFLRKAVKKPSKVLATQPERLGESSDAFRDSRNPRLQSPRPFGSAGTFACNLQRLSGQPEPSSPKSNAFRGSRKALENPPKPSGSERSFGSDFRGFPAQKEASRGIFEPFRGRRKGIETSWRRSG